MYYILFYKTVENYEEKRAPYRAEHLKYVMKAYEEGTLVMAGALTDPADSAVLIFKCGHPEIPETFARNDIYVREGVIKSWEVRKWNVVIGV